MPFFVLWKWLFFSISTKSPIELTKSEILLHAHTINYFFVFGSNLPDCLLVTPQLFYPAVHRPGSCPSGLNGSEILLVLFAKPRSTAFQSVLIFHVFHNQSRNVRFIRSGWHFHIKHVSLYSDTAVHSGQQEGSDWRRHLLQKEA